jgi:hypothetical protein
MRLLLMLELEFTEEHEFKIRIAKVNITIFLDL